MNPFDPDFTRNIFGLTGLIIAGSFCFTIVLVVGIGLWMRKIINPHGKMKDAVLAQATILNMWDTGVTLNDNPQVGMLLEVHPTDRPAYQVQTKAVISRFRLLQYQVGAVVPVKYDPTDPSKVILAS
ncbi:MAG: hypothetical protein L0332_03840 [Chloroflexi bacterium]|nr:hypothetical protein [Chloroflexota bacterium]MCI0576801.1 hypothetical protein [Chloroflexota bacterium]MCI0643308.1 hypothetical protein [Chloroflexota bacterium]MCI0725843.1 hypothetical protein [Chloroflexota bacterium]